MDLFETAVLNRVVDQRVDDTQWLVDTFFPEISLSEEETIYFDKTTSASLSRRSFRRSLRAASLPTGL
jgi:energy-converting hydrogenase A subunit M